MNELEVMTRLLSLLEVGRKISAARRQKIVACVQALQAVLAEDPTEASEAQRTAALAEARELVEAELSYSEKERLIRDAIRAKHGAEAVNAAGERVGPWVWLENAYDTYAIYTVEPRDGTATKLFQVSYVLLDGKVTLGEPVEVRRVVTYEPVTPTQEEAAEVELLGDLVPLVEAKLSKQGTVPIKVISPGWGSSGHYPAEVLKRDGPQVFKKGLHMHVDHPTAAEEAARPERSVNTIGAVLASDAVWQENGPAGPGLYASAKPLGDFKERLPELAPHIGVSIRALGKAKQGEADGKKGPIIESIVAAKSVDFVTQAGAGGKVLELFEAARDGRPLAPPAGQEVYTVNEQEAQALQEANAALTQENARLKEVLLLREARDLCVEVLGKLEVPDLTRTRLAESLAKSPPVKDGQLDRDAFKTQIEEAAKAELEYLGKVTGKGEIKGMGSAAPAPAGERTALVEAWERTFRAQGESPESAKRLAELAVG